MDQVIKIQSYGPVPCFHALWKLALLASTIAHYLVYECQLAKVRRQKPRGMEQHAHNFGCRQVYALNNCGEKLVSWTMEQGREV